MGSFGVLCTVLKYQFRQDWPGIYHNNATMFSYADGHADKQRWYDPRTLNPPDPIPYGAVTSRGNKDIAWMQERTTEKDNVVRTYVCLLYTSDAADE